MVIHISSVIRDRQYRQRLIVTGAIDAHGRLPTPAWVELEPCLLLHEDERVRFEAEAAVWRDEWASLTEDQKRARLTEFVPAPMTVFESAEAEQEEAINA